jgi:hypothetical protein
MYEIKGNLLGQCDSLLALEVQLDAIATKVLFAVVRMNKISVLAKRLGVEHPPFAL